MEQGKPVSVELLEMGMGGWLASALAVAAKLGVADLIKGGARSAAELARETKSDEGALYRLLRTLAGRGVFREVAGKKFELTPMAELLREDAPGSVRQAVIMFNRPWNSRSYEELAYSVQTGKPSFEKVFGMDSWKWFAQHAEDQDIFNRAMTNLSAGRQAAAVDACDWSGISKIVDVGGGHGQLLSLVLKKSPGMRGVVFDQAHVVTGARAVFQANGVADRAEAVGGDFFERIPGEFDAVMLSHIIHDWDDQKSAAILQSCRRAVKSGGRLLLFENVIKPGNDPDMAKLIDLEMLVAVGGKERSEEEFGVLMRGAGFALKRVIAAKSGVSVVEGVAV